MSRESTQFKKGMTPWNKGKFGYMGANKTSFTKDTIKCKYKVGEPRMGKQQLICRTTDVIPTKSYNGKIYNHHKRVSYAKIVMEQYLGRKLFSNEIVYHKDHDIYNNDISNLEIISRSELLIRNRTNKKEK